MKQLELAAPKAAQLAAAKREEAADLEARLGQLQAAVEVGAEDAARLAELSKQLSKETAQLAKLRASCDGLQKKATALQVRSLCWAKAALQHCTVVQVACAINPTAGCVPAASLCMQQWLCLPAQLW